MMFKHFSESLSALALLALASTAHAGEVTVSGAWLRAVPPVSPTMAGYFELNNDSDSAVTLNGASADFAGMAMLHGTETKADGQRSMTHVDAVTLKPGESVTFAPGGKHLMLMKLSTVPPSGEVRDICLTFTDHDDLCVPFQVRHNDPNR
ncbi:copper chaperone PCu(A)C [Alloalcanivorax mobilis]|uniref:copper chaperone PCu(A)C n=1 Tax=Alloalcanivorax mobilis TaxID=2019569 RepID=UPI000C769491|nr:copper chaperone PCu(A)C [Alloalcanivorax mobilis]